MATKKANQLRKSNIINTNVWLQMKLKMAANQVLKRFSGKIIKEDASNYEIERRTFIMAYSCDIGNGQRLFVQNHGEETRGALSSGDSGQQQNQSTGFTTGEWSKPPELFRTSENLVLRVEGKNGVRFIGVHSDQIELMRSEPKLENAEKLTLQESNEKIAQMKPMKPMKPMEPMKPMKPMN